jgi:hypothetical protein
MMDSLAGNHDNADDVPYFFLGLGIFSGGVGVARGTVSCSCCGVPMQFL